MFDELYLIPAFAVTLIALIAAPMGSVILWQRQSFLSDTLAHASLLGVAMAAVLNMQQFWGIAFIGIMVGILLVITRKSARYLSRDALLALVAQGALALGLLAVNWRRPAGMSPLSFLFGDLLSVDESDLLSLLLGLGIAAIVRFILWRPIMAITASESLAQLDGIPVVRTRLLFSICLAMVVALLLKMVGALLLSALLLIPAATGRLFARNPQQMVSYAALSGVLFGHLGLYCAFYFDHPVAPMIVVAGLLGLVLCHGFRNGKIS